MRTIALRYTLYGGALFLYLAALLVIDSFAVPGDSIAIKTVKSLQVCAVGEVSEPAG